MTIMTATTTNNNNSAYNLLISTIEDFVLKCLFEWATHYLSESKKIKIKTIRKQITYVCIHVCMYMVFFFSILFPRLLVLPKATLIISLLGIFPKQNKNVVIYCKTLYRDRDI